MATYSLRKFAQSDVLKHVDDDIMLQFLEPYRPYLSARGFVFEKNVEGRIDHANLVRILLNPVEGIPTEMVDALYFVQEVAGGEDFEAIIELAQKAGVDVVADATPEDLVVRIWLKDSNLIKQQHADTLVLKPKKFLSFQARDAEGFDADLSPGAIQNLVRDMKLWFEQNGRGEGCEILRSDMPEEKKIYFLVRHGMPFKREGKMDSGRTGSIFYRPEAHDVIVYDIEANELAIHNKSNGKKERAMYLDVFGRHLFADPDRFPNEDKYTLDPLREDGEDSLSCQDILGIEEIKLTALGLQFQGPYGDNTMHRSKDMFASLGAREKDFPAHGRISEARFMVKFSHSEKPRSVTIKPPNVASFDRKEDAHTIELWMKARGFIKRPSEQAEQTEAVEERTPRHDTQAAVAYT